MTDYTILGKDAAKYQYEHGQILPNFPVGSFDNRYDQLLVEHGVNVWKTQREYFHRQAQKEFPGISDDGLAVKAYFQLRHLNPSFNYDKAHDIAVLSYPIAGSKEYFGIETNAATMKRMLEKEVRLNASQRELILTNKTKIPDGIPARMVHEAYEQLKLTQHIFEETTGVKLEDVPDLLQSKTARVETLQNYEQQKVEMLYCQHYGIDEKSAAVKKLIGPLDELALKN